MTLFENSGVVKTMWHTYDSENSIKILVEYEYEQIKIVNRFFIWPPYDEKYY